MPSRPAPTSKEWGFVCYRTTYGDDEKWERVKAKLAEFLESQRGELNGGGDLGLPDDPEDAMIKFIEDAATLDGKTSQEIRKIFNPEYEPGTGDLADRDDYFCYTVCLMIDAASMNSILNGTDDRPGYVVAVDAVNEESEKSMDWDGTIMVDNRFLWSEFYNSVADNSLIMGEVHCPMGHVWTGIMSNDWY